MVRWGIARVLALARMQGMKRLAASAGFALLVFGVAFSIADAKLQEIVQGDKSYYVVTSTDPAMDSGNEVCALAGKKCVGYTAFSQNVCALTHPTAKKVSDANGSKAGFYCDGAPQGGVCANEKNTCHICPTCNVNADCSTQIGDLYREMYIECSAGDSATTVKAPGWFSSVFSVPGRWWGSMRDSVVRSFDMFRERLGRLTMITQKHVVIQVQGPDGTVSADVPTDSYVCEFYQQNKKLATCGALAAADGFCVTAMNSRFAKAALCQDNGIIVCSNPCTTNPKQVMPKQCAFDNDRPRGKQASPLNFCTETKTIQVDMGGLGQPTQSAKKKAGEQCAHGGECGTGYCLGQPSDNGIKYFCSCSQTRHDTSCGK